MCGIVGVITKRGITHFHEKFLAQALYVDALRGFHSTGVAAVLKSGNVDVVKKAMNAYDFLAHKSFDKFTTRSATHRAYIGHNRHATVGDVTNVNAHPFTIGDITMVHNGSLRSRWDLPDYLEFDVDSENICHSLNKIGVDDTISKLQGSFALVWYNKAEKKIHMVRNAERSLSFGTTDEGNILFASEDGMLSWLADRNRITLTNIYDVDVGNLISFDLEAERMEDYEIREVKLWSAPKSRHQANRNAQGYARTPTQEQHGVYNPTEVAASKGKSQGGSSANSTKSQDNKSGMPAVIDYTDISQERGKRQQKFFDLAGVKKDEVIEFTPLEWCPYNVGDPNGRGVAKGCTTNEPFMAIEIHGIEEDIFELGSSYLSPVMSIRNLSKDEVKVHTLSLILNGKDIISAYDEDEDGNIILPNTKEDSDDSEFAELDVPFRSEDEIREKGREGDTFQFLIGPNGIALPADEWNRLTRHGCCHCGGNLFEKDHKNVKWINTHSPMCVDCQQLWENFAEGKGPLPEKESVH